jgi:predicted  nucleic acid-binding Zn-ribbon protein
MKFAIAISFLLTTSLCLAQGKEEVKRKADSILSKLDTIKLPSVALPTSVKNQIKKSDSLKIKVSSKYDSIKNLTNKTQDKINQYNSKMDSVAGRFTKPADSIARLAQKPQEKIDQYKNKIDATQAHLTKKIDSLLALPNPNKFLAKRLDSLRGSMDSLRQKLTKLPPGVEKSKEAVEKLTSSIGEKTGKIESAINEKLGLFSKNGASNLPASVSLPSAKLPVGLNVPGMKDQSLKLPGNNLKLPQSSLPNMPGANTGNGLGLSIGKSSVPSLKTPELGQLKELDGVKNVGNVTNEISQLSSEAGKYGKQLKDIQSNDMKGLSKEAEDKAGSLLGGEKQLADLKAQEAMLAKWNSDPAVAKELALNKAKEEAVNHFAGKEKELKAVMEQLSGLKAKAKDTEGVIDLFKKKQENPMKSKSFRERLDLGISLQLLSRGDVLMMDFNPYAGYRISGRFTAGVGWVQRLPISTKNYSIVEVEDVYGPRTYLQFKIKGNAFLKAEVEFLNEFVRLPGQGPSREKGRQWVTDYLVGYKQSFKFSKKLGGHVQILYNLFDPFYQSPYIERINIRFGFEFPQRKKINSIN